MIANVADSSRANSTTRSVRVLAASVYDRRGDAPRRCPLNRQPARFSTAPRPSGQRRVVSKRNETHINKKLPCAHLRPRYSRKLTRQQWFTRIQPK